MRFLYGPNPRRIPCCLAICLIMTLALINCSQLIPGVWFAPEERLEPALMRRILRSFGLPPSINGGATGATVTRTVRRVHFMYKDHMVSANYKQFIASWRKTYPTYELYFWTDRDLETLVTRRYPHLSGFYKLQLKNPLERSDFARILVLHSFGGWYADLDAGSQVSAEALTERHSLIAPLEPYTHAMAIFNMRKLVNNGVMYSAAGHPYWMFYVDRIVQQVDSLPVDRSNVDVPYTTGPVIQTRTMDLFLQANSLRCGGDGGYWCPYVPEPGLFLPLIDNRTNGLTRLAWVLCLTVFTAPKVTDECNRMAARGYANELPPNAYSYHAFLHMNYDKYRVRSSLENVSSWGLNLMLNPLSHLA